MHAGHHHWLLMLQRQESRSSEQLSCVALMLQVLARQDKPAMVQRKHPKAVQGSVSQATMESNLAKTVSLVAKVMGRMVLEPGIKLDDPCIPDLHEVTLQLVSCLAWALYMS